jgi:hypothetical protein
MSFSQARTALLSARNGTGDCSCDSDVKNVARAHGNKAILPTSRRPVSSKAITFTDRAIEFG